MRRLAPCVEMHSIDRKQSLLNRDQTAGLAIGERLQDNGINHSEYRGSRPNADAENQHRRYSETWILSKLPTCESKVLDRPFHPLPVPRIPGRLLNHIDTAEISKRGSSSLSRRLAPIDSFLSFQRDVSAKLLIHFALQVTPPKDVAPISPSESVPVHGFSSNRLSDTSDCPDEQIPL